MHRSLCVFFFHYTASVASQKFVALLHCMAPRNASVGILRLRETTSPWGGAAEWLKELLRRDTEIWQKCAW
jgi:hypothetical protein